LLRENTAPSVLQSLRCRRIVAEVMRIIMVINAPLPGNGDDPLMSMFIVACNDSLTSPEPAPSRKAS
jgi:hypothetical protein